MKKLIQFSVAICLSLLVSEVFSQVVTKSFSGTVAGATCPGVNILYEVSLPTGFGSCQITWTATNGEVQSQSGNTVYIKWNDTPGTKAREEKTNRHIAIKNGQLHLAHSVQRRSGITKNNY